MAINLQQIFGSFPVSAKLYQKSEIRSNELIAYLNNHVIIYYSCFPNSLLGINIHSKDYEWHLVN